MNPNQNVLILDDEEGFRKEIGEYLTGKNMRVFSAGLPSEAMNQLDINPIDFALLDIRLPEMDGLSFLKKMKETYPEVDVIMMTGYGEVESVVKALRFGAADFLSKPFSLSELNSAIDRVSKYQNIRKNTALQTELHSHFLNKNIRLLGESQAMKTVIELIHKIARSGDTTALICGESGSGKELVANAIHLLSNRSGNRFIPVNCSTIPDELFESEFFGHVKGSFTDAKQDQKGLFEVADKGTLFLDEIGDLKFSIQAKLLRVIEDKKVSRIGRYDEKVVDVRVIAATNQNLEELVILKKFRIDLYHRLNLFRIDLPPLRDRKEDIPQLFDFFVDESSKKLGKHFKKIEKSVIGRLMEYDFPGNVRELKNITERAIILCDSDVLTLDCFKNLTNEPHKKDNIKPKKEIMDLIRMEMESILSALELCGKNKSKAAKMLGISRQALDRKLNKFNL